MRTGTARIITPTVCLPCKKDYCPTNCSNYNIMQEAMNAAKKGEEKPAGETIEKTD